jgi:hypothetical protein
LQYQGTAGDRRARRHPREGDRTWHPGDDRISLLMLERDFAPTLGLDVELEVSLATP